MTSTDKQLRERIRRLEMMLRQLHEVTVPIEHSVIISQRDRAVIAGARLAAKSVLEEKP